ncbi:hypothetical protein [Methylobacterium haplocladii]|uniref:hypothetical protein n=1 Tax=Methylobacterium haplocladii TaxID=1176176 RepID=UPI0011BFBF7E|nr:hypothetical protein [Methylobacterium haplocladii]GJD86172.1 hypothetical protein HPGCJGGD_4069 [Methylobacterium haplocladii]
MRYLDTMPAWAARQRSRRLVRHSDEKVVRWINHNQDVKDGVVQPGSERSSNDNVVAFAATRAAQAH